jgi:hypothetical protein
MRAAGTFELHVEPETETRLAKVSLVLIGAVPDERGVVHLTPDCHRLHELEDSINALQDELDLARAAARRIFVGVVGHA